MMTNTTRRTVLKQTIFTSLALCFTSPFAFAGSSPVKGPFTLPSLDYPYNALEPFVDAKTMEIHLTRHHQAYIDKLNMEVSKTPALQGKTVEQILSDVSRFNKTARNNAGGHWNHSFFWKLMAPKEKRGEISADLKAAIEKKFGTMEKFQSAFNDAGVAQFGSGWVWLIKNAKGELEITSTANQDNPLMDDAKVKGTPILGNDVWEHAYYLTYQNKRADYLKSWWNVVNWRQVSENYSTSLK